MKVLTLHQPYATLIALGIKTIETRPQAWRTLVGQRVAIHAAATTAGIDTLCFDTEGGWRYGDIGPYQIGWCCRTSDEGRHGDTFLTKAPTQWATPAELDAPEHDGPLPLGAIVCTAVVTDSLPMVEWGECRAAVTEPYPQHICVSDGKLRLVRSADEGTDIESERPYGDFRPGRHGLLLADVEVLPEPVPFKGGQGLSRSIDPAWLRKWPTS